MLGTLRRALAHKTVYVINCYSTDTYMVEAASSTEAKAIAFEAGIDPDSVEYISQAQDLLEEGGAARL